MNDGSIQANVLNAFLSDAVYSYKFDVTTGIVSEEIITRDGINYTEKMGLTVPYHFDDSVRDSVLKKMKVSYASAADRNETITQKLLLSAFENGIKKMENVICFEGAGKYLKLTYFLWQAPEDGHVWAFSVCEDITEGWTRSSIAHLEAQKRLLKHEAEEAKKKYLREFATLSAIGRTFFAIYRLDVRTGAYEVIAGRDELRRIAGERGNFKTVVSDIVASFVLPEYCEKVADFAEYTSLSERMSSCDTIELEYLSRNGEWHEIRFFAEKRDESGELENVLLTVRVLSQEKQLELENDRHRLEKLNKELRDRIKMIDGLTNAVVAAYQADLQTGEYIPAKVTAFSNRFTDGFKCIKEAFEKYIPYGVHSEDIEKMRIFTDIDTLADRLKTVDVIDVIFHSTVPEREWDRAEWICTERDAEGNAVYALFVVEDVTETIKRREARSIEIEENYKLEQLKIQTIMEAIHGGFKIGKNDSDFSFITISDQLAQMLGYDSPEEMMKVSGGTMKGISNNEDAALALPDAFRCVAENRMYTMNYRMRCKDGSWKNVEDRGRLIRKPNGEEEYWSFISDRDELIQKTKALEAAERAKEEIMYINAISEAAAKDIEDQFLIDLDKKISTSIKVHGHIVSSEKRVSRPYEDTWKWYAEKFVHPEDREGLLKAVNLPQVLEGLKRYPEYFCRFRALKGDDYHYCQATFSYVGEYGSNKIVFGYRNIDALVLEERRKVAEIADLNEKLEQANKAKTSFLFNMSHDIRTPMNAILGYSGLIKKELKEPKLLHYQEKMEQAGEFLLSLINNVLDMARIESGKMEVDNEVIAPNDVIMEMFGVFEPSAVKKNIDFTINTDIKTPYLVADSLKVKEIYNNLISNSIKYTPDGGAVKVFAREAEGAPEGYVIIESVFEDTGIGMSREFLEHIFDEFSREKNTTESQVIGTGLGMAIVKRLVDLMDGTIAIESEPGKGTRTVVRLPHKIADEICSGAESKLREKNDDYTELFEGRRILLAEDNELNAEIAMAVLADEGFYVDWVQDGIECVDRMEKMPAGSYDFILMDIQMPNMNGYKATQIIRKFPDSGKADIPIIAMTANAFEEDRKRAIESGMNEHIAKPIDVPKLLKTLAEILK